jgi:hypothetical protein
MMSVMLSDEMVGWVSDAAVLTSSTLTGVVQGSNTVGRVDTQMSFKPATEPSRLEWKKISRPSWLIAGR